MTRYIVEILDTYLSKGATVREVNSLIEMLEEYKREVQGRWGNSERHLRFKVTR